MWESRGNLVASQIRDKLKRNADCSRTHGGGEERVKEIRIVCTKWSISIYEIHCSFTVISFLCNAHISRKNHSTNGGGSGSNRIASWDYVLSGGARSRGSSMRSTIAQLAVVWSIVAQLSVMSWKNWEQGNWSTCLLVGEKGEWARGNGGFAASSYCPAAIWRDFMFFSTWRRCAHDATSSVFRRGTKQHWSERKKRQWRV
jgi:hypothetical protein